MESRRGLPPLRSSEEGPSLDSGTPLEVPGVDGGLPDGLRKPAGPCPSVATPTLNLGTPLEPAPTRKKLAACHQDPGGAPAKPVPRRSPRHTAMVGGIPPMGFEGPATVPHYPAPDVGPARDAGALNLQTGGLVTLDTQKGDGDHCWAATGPMPWTRGQGVCPLPGVGFPRPPQSLGQRLPREWPHPRSAEGPKQLQRQQKTQVPRERPHPGYAEGPKQQQLQQMPQAPSGEWLPREWPHPRSAEGPEPQQLQQMLRAPLGVGPQQQQLQQMTRVPPGE